MAATIQTYNDFDLNDRTTYFTHDDTFVQPAALKYESVEYLHRPGGRIGQLTEGMRIIEVNGLVLGATNDLTEQLWYELVARLRSPRGRLVMTTQGDDRLYIATCTEIKSARWLGGRIVYQATFVAEHPYARALYPSADVAAAPTFATIVDPVPPAGDAYKTAILALKPRVYWRLGEASGATAMIDSSGNGCHGEYVNTPTLGVTGSMSGETDTAVTFASASSQYARTTVGYSPLDTNNTFTYMFAVKRASVGTTQVIFSEGPSSWVVQFYFNSSNKLVLEAASGNTIYTSTLTMNSTSAWYHVAITKSGTTTAMYVNGTSTANASGSDFTISTAGSGRGAATTVHLGANRTPGNYLNGTLDEFTVFGEALTASQISELYALWSGSTDAMRGTTRTLTTDGDMPAPVRTLWAVRTGSSTVSRWELANLTPVRYGQAIQRARVSYSSPPRSIGVMDPLIGGAVYDATNVAGYWPLADASGNAVDFSGNDYTLTANGTITRLLDGVWLDGRPHGWGGSARCNGSGSYFSSTQTAFNASSAWTAGLWVNLLELTGGAGIIGKAESNKGWSIYVASDGTVNASIGTGAATSTASSVTKLLPRTWYHLVLTYAESPSRRLRVYVDGLREGESAPGSNVSSSTNALNVGRTVHTNGTTYTCNGHITEPFVLSVELTQQQIRDVRRLGLPFLGTRRPIVGYVPELDPALGTTNALRVAGWNTSAAPDINALVSWRAEWR